ncbi:MAG: hypothetical protein OEY14_02235 [Myxococcales bacterium]|nr:hypothetical protein [Myxococcales bacterium]
MESRDVCNALRYDGGSGGHYESYFQRANHPDRPLAFWIRYTVFVPKGTTHGLGELWAIYFDGEQERITAVKEVRPLDECTFSRSRLDARIGASTLNGRGLEGEARTGEDRIGWALEYASSEPPLLFLPESLYAAPFPKAKALVGSPLARYRGRLEINEISVEIDDWIGSQNHNWGSKHTDQYAWGQVAGFDDAPDSFLELSTARIKLGPLWTPWLSLAVLRHEGHEYRLNTIRQALRAKGSYDFFEWELESRRRDVGLRVKIRAGAEAFVGLPYENPPGGQKTCLNSKLASCELELLRRGLAPTQLRTKHRAAFEILTERSDHGVPILAT